MLALPDVSIYLNNALKAKRVSAELVSDTTRIRRVSRRAKGSLPRQAVAADHVLRARFRIANSTRKPTNRPTEEPTPSHSGGPGRT